VGPREGHPQPTGAHGLELAQWRALGGGTARGANFVVNPYDGAPKTLLPAPVRAPAWHRMGPDGALWCAESIYRSFFKMTRPPVRFSPR